ncbi:MAG TPA: CAP domain-containing protein [Candidatus Limnocylindrales bacterium]|nr:CAP domain-containing protein [Candidatus Limnocylindrales bacterium]
MTFRDHPRAHARRLVHRPRLNRRRRLAVAVMIGSATLVASPGLPTLTGTGPRASASVTPEAALLGWINHDRVARGLHSLRDWSALDSLATARAATMARYGVCSHSIAGDIGAQLTSRRMSWYAYGEAIGVTSATWGTTAASRLYSLFKSSPAHWAILMSSRYNYIGIGVGHRSSTHETYLAIVETESPDHTPPSRSITSAWRSGTTIGWSWTASDVALQTHTAHLEGFDINVRRDGGSWTRVRTDTTTRSLTLSGRAHGHTYSIAVRSRDHADNFSSWTYRSIFVP